MERTTLQPPHRSMFSKTSLHTSHAADLLLYPGHLWCVHRLAIGQGQGWGILPHLTTLIIQDLVLVPGSGAGGHTTLGWVTGVYLSTVFCGGYNPSPPDNGSSMIYAAKFILKYLFHIYCHLILEFYWLLVTGKGQTFLNYTRNR